MKYFHLNLAILSSTTFACINNNGPLQDFHNQVHKELQNTLKDLHEDTMESLSEWHEVGQTSFEQNSMKLPALNRLASNQDETVISNDPNNPEETHDSFSNDFNNDSSSFFSHPFANLNNMMHNVFNNMGAFFGFGHELVGSDVVSTENGTEYKKTLHNITDEEGKVVGKRTTYNIEGPDNSEDDSSFYQVQSSIIFSDIVSVSDSFGSDYNINSPYYSYNDDSASHSDGSESDEDEFDNINNMAGNNENKESGGNVSDELESLFQQNEKTSYRRPNYKDSERLNIASADI